MPNGSVGPMGARGPTPKPNARRQDATHHKRRNLVIPAVSICPLTAEELAELDAWPEYVAYYGKATPD